MVLLERFEEGRIVVVVWYFILLLYSREFQIVELIAGQPKTDLNSCDFLRIGDFQ